jgi:hypothetical protein
LERRDNAWCGSINTSTVITRTTLEGKIFATLGTGLFSL